MNNKTSQSSKTLPLAAWLASAWGFLARLGPVSRAFIMLSILLLFAIPTLAKLVPRRITPASAPPEVFSAERALVHLSIIAREPHAQGSAAQERVREYLVEQLTGMGLAEVQVQQTKGPENVVARLRGTNPTGAIVILAHYDTVSYSPGAGDNGSAVTVLLEVMRALAADSAPRNDIIALFDDGEEWPDIFAGTKAFVREHPWMSDVRVAISIDTAVTGSISTNEVGPEENGWLVHALARAYTGGAWTSFSGGGQYNSTPFRDAGYQVLALEDNYPYRQKHTAEDVPAIIQPGSVQQMGEQTLAIARELASLDLTNPRGEQETFFPLPFLPLVHYPQAWSLPLAIASGALLITAFGLALWRKLVSWGGLGVAFAAILVTCALCVVGINALKPRLPGLFGWQTTRWEEWPEVIPPHGWLAAGLLGFLVLALAVGFYLLFRRWSRRTDFSLVGLVPFLVVAIALSIAEPRTAYAFIWPTLIGSLGWIAAAAFGQKHPGWAQDLAATLVALTVVVFLLIFLPSIIMSDGMKSLEILAGIEALFIALILPAVDGLLVRKSARQ